MSFVSFLLILNGHGHLELNLFEGKYSSLFHDIFVKEITIQNVFVQSFFFICQHLFQIFCCTFCDKLAAQMCQEIISSTFKEFTLSFRQSSWWDDGIVYNDNYMVELPDNRVATDRDNHNDLEEYLLSINNALIMRYSKSEYYRYQTCNDNLL